MITASDRLEVMSYGNVSTVAFRLMTAAVSFAQMKFLENYQNTPEGRIPEIDFHINLASGFFDLIAASIQDNDNPLFTQDPPIFNQAERAAIYRLIKDYGKSRCNSINAINVSMQELLWCLVVGSWEDINAPTTLARAVTPLPEQRLAGVQFLYDAAMQVLTTASQSLIPGLLEPITIDITVTPSDPE